MTAPSASGADAFGASGGVAGIGWLLAAGLLACSCAAEQNHVVPTCSYGRPYEDPIDVFVRDVLTSGRMYEDQECRWIAATMEGWDEAQLLCASRTALSYLKPEYARRVHHSVAAFLHWCEMARGFPEMRRWLRRRVGDQTEETVSVVADATAMNSVTYPLPELFDIFSHWVMWGASSPILDMFGGSAGTPMLEWHAYDEGAQGLWSVFGGRVPQFLTWRRGRSFQGNVEYQEEWRVKMPEWLEAHPEARSYWIQRYCDNLRSIHRSYSSNTKTLERAAVVAKAIEAYEREFAFELTDRRGICAEAEWNQEK